MYVYDAVKCGLIPLRSVFPEKKINFFHGGSVSWGGKRLFLS